MTPEAPLRRAARADPVRAAPARTGGWARRAGFRVRSGGSPTAGLRRSLRPVSRRGRWRRTVAARLASAVLAGAAVWLAVSALVPAPPDPGVPVLVAARDLPLGGTIAADDVRVDHRPDAYVPRGAMTTGDLAVGRVLSAPVMAGEALTAVRFRGPGQLAALPVGSVAVSLPVSDLGVVTSLRPADLVSVLVTGSGETVAASAAVLATDVPAGGMLGGPGTTSPHVWLALTSTEARAVAVALGASTPAAFLLAPHR